MPAFGDRLVFQLTLYFNLPSVAIRIAKGNSLGARLYETDSNSERFAIATSSRRRNLRGQPGALASSVVVSGFFDVEAMYTIDRGSSASGFYQKRSISRLPKK